MKNWLIIKNNVVVSIVKKDTNIVNEDCLEEFDTVQDDPSEKFKEGDIFSLDQWYLYNPVPLSDAATSIEAI